MESASVARSPAPSSSAKVLSEKPEPESVTIVKVPAGDEFGEIEFKSSEAGIGVGDGLGVGVGVGGGGGLITDPPPPDPPQPTRNNRAMVRPNSRN